MPKLLIENLETPILLEIVEGRGDGKIIARGEFGRVGVPTANGRNYPTKLMNREITRLSEDLNSRRVLGELDHPTDGKTSLKRVSHVITSLKIKDGIVVGEAEILNTREGKQLKALIEGKIPLGISSRGYGSTQPGDSQDEGEIVQDDFVLKTYDFVSDPAMRTATPAVYAEDIDDNTAAQLFLEEFPEVAQQLRGSSDSTLLMEGKKGPTIEERIKEAVEAERNKMTENFEKKLAKSLIETKETVSSDLREEFAKDPEVGGSKATLAAIAEMIKPYLAIPSEAIVDDAIKAKDIEVAEAVAERDKAVGLARSAAWRLYVEREVKDHSMAESILKLIAVDNCESLDEVKEKLKTIMADLPEIEDDGRVSEEEASLREENAELKGEVTLLTSTVDNLKAKVQKAVTLGERIDEQLGAATLRAEDAEIEREKALLEAKEAGEKVEKAEKKLEIETYKHEKVAGLVNGRELLSLMEGAPSKAAVDKVVSSKGATEVSDGELADMRKSLGKGTSGGQPLTENNLPQQSGAPSIDELGHDMTEMRALAGLDS